MVKLLMPTIYTFFIHWTTDTVYSYFMLGVHTMDFPFKLYGSASQLLLKEPAIGEIRAESTTPSSLYGTPASEPQPGRREASRCGSVRAIPQPITAAQAWQSWQLSCPEEAQSTLRFLSGRAAFQYLIFTDSSHGRLYLEIDN